MANPGVSLFPAQVDDLNITRTPNAPNLSGDSNDQGAAIKAVQTYSLTLGDRIEALETLNSQATPTSNQGQNAWVALASPGSMAAFNGTNQTFSEAFLLFFDDDQVPQNGDSPIMPGFQLPKSNGTTSGSQALGQEYFGTQGAKFLTGIACAFSSTPGALTLVSATGLTAGVMVRG